MKVCPFCNRSNNHFNIECIMCGSTGYIMTGSEFERAHVGNGQVPLENEDTSENQQNGVYSTHGTD